jgi:hypothetical protein
LITAATATAALSVWLFQEPEAGQKQSKKWKDSEVAVWALLASYPYIFDQILV